MKGGSKKIAQRAGDQNYKKSRTPFISWNFYVECRRMSVMKYIVICTVLLGVMACGPMTDEEEAFFREREAARKQREDFSRSISTVARESDAIALVKEHEMEEADGVTVVEWTVKDRMHADGQVIFPRWRAIRRSPHKFEVQYTYTLLTPENEILHKGYAWKADLLLKLVSAHRKMDPSELDTTGRREGYRPRRDQPSEEETFSLE